MSIHSSEVLNVLIVEDEMLLRMRAVDIVEDAGFRPVEAVNADEAIAILESRSDISLLFTDIQMPGSMDGLKLAPGVHDRCPSIKIILVSGQVQPTESERPADSRFFGKPLSVEQMISELQAMVGAGALQIVSNPAMHLGSTPFSERGNLNRSRGPRRRPSCRQRTTAFACCWNKPASTPRPCSRKPASTPRNARPPTSCRS